MNEHERTSADDGRDLPDRKPRIAYFGPPATNTHMAAVRHFGPSVAYEACSTIADVFQAVDEGKADYGVVPVENSTEGAVTPTLDEFATTSVKIVAEHYQPIAHHLMARCALEDVRLVCSHPQVLGQCRKWLRANMPGVDQMAVSSTARAAERATREAGCAALAGEMAAERFRLETLARDVQDISGNTTRFLVLARKTPPPTGDDKTSLVLSVRDRVGALYDALGAFRTHNLNMSKIESRPSKFKAWEYVFFIDIGGHVHDESVRNALSELERHCTRLTVLGSYPRARRTGESS